MSKVKANVVIEKSFDDAREFEKNWVNGDFEEFFSEEGMYVDRLSNIVNGMAADSEGFTITYRVTVKKSK